MRKERGQNRTMRRRSRMLVSAAVVATVTSIGASGCVFLGQQSSVPDVSAMGQVQYACALVDKVNKERPEVVEWGSFIGEDAEPGMAEALAAGSLVGGSPGYSLPAFPELSAAGADLVQSLSRVDIDGIEAALGAMTVECDGITGPSVDVSSDGQGVYACALAEYVLDEHGDSSTWGAIGVEPAWHMAASVGALFGGMNASVLPEYEEQAEASRNLVGAVMFLDSDRTTAELQNVVAECGN